MKTVILGASGFIGQNLLQSNDSTLALSLREPLWRAGLQDAEVIINLVGKAHDHDATATENDFYVANVDCAKLVFESFIASEAKLLIHISSIAALEEFEASVALKENDACRPVSWYGKSKLAAEVWLMQQELPVDKKLIILRPPMVHGPGDKGNLGLLYTFISKGIPYPLAAYNNSRSFISIDNLRYFVKLIILKHIQLDSGIYHVSDDEPVSTSSIIKLIKKVTGKNSMNLSLPKFLVNGLAKLGDYIPIPLNTKRLKKMTSDLLVSNQKIKTALRIEKLPLTAEEGLEITIKSFNKSQ